MKVLKSSLLVLAVSFIEGKRADHWEEPRYTLKFCHNFPVYTIYVKRIQDGAVGNFYL